MRLTITFLLSASLFCFSCSSQSCKDLTTSFKTHNTTTNTIRSTSFNTEESYSNFSSSWVSKIEYYSCDNKVGFLIYTTKAGKDYIHQEVPIVKWHELKHADSKGRYINQNLKGRYSVSIE